MLAAAGAAPDTRTAAPHTRMHGTAREGRPRQARVGRARKGHRPCLLQAQHVHAHLAGGVHYCAHVVHQRLRGPTACEVRSRPSSHTVRAGAATPDRPQAGHGSRAACADARSLAHAGSAARSSSGAALQRRPAHPRLLRKRRVRGRHYRVLHQADLDLAALPQLLRGCSEAVRLCPRPGPCQVATSTRAGLNMQGCNCRSASARARMQHPSRQGAAPLRPGCLVSSRKWECQLQTRLPRSAPTESAALASTQPD